MSLPLKIGRIIYTLKTNYSKFLIIIYMEDKNMIYGYIRVSTDKQTVENQRFEITHFLNSQNLKVESWVEETISGTKNYDKRQLGKLLKKLQSNDILVCTEISRLGRSLFMVMEILNICMKKNCRVWTIKDNFRLGDDIQSKVLAFAFGLSAEIERNLISQRTREALSRKKEEGVILGRPKGRKSSYNKLTGKEDLILSMLNSKSSIISIAKKCHVNRGTIYKYLNNINYKS